MFDEWKKNKAISRHKGILKYLTKDVEIPTEEEAENDEDKTKIYEGISKKWDLLIISSTEINFGLVRQCDENTHDAWKALIEKYEVSDEKQKSLNGVTNRWNNCKVKYTSLDPDIWFNELYNLNLNFKNINAKYENDEDKLKAHIFDVLP